MPLTAAPATPDTLLSGILSHTGGVSPDSLAVDSLYAGHWSDPTPAPPVDPLWRDPLSIFGPDSSLSSIAGAGFSPDAVSLTDNVAVKGVVLLLFISYCIVLTLFGSQLRGLSGLLAGRKGTDRVLDQQGNLTHNFINVALWMGAATLILIAVKAVPAAFIPPFWPSISGLGTSLMVALFMAAALLAVLTFQWLLLRITGHVTLAGAFTHRLQSLRRTIGALASMCLTPLVIFWTVSFGQAGHALGIAVAVVALLIALLLMLRTIQLFREQRVSFLYWILYLCAVEIFPVSFVVLLAIR